MLTLLLVTASGYLEGTTGTMTGSITSFLGGAFGVNFGFGFAARRVRERELDGMLLKPNRFSYRQIAGSWYCID